MKLVIGSIIAASAALLASSANAQSQPQQAAQAAAPAAQSASNDPVICEKQEVTGSRLATRKVCMKRSQWQDQQLQERQTIERAQVNRTLPGAGG
jgi:hypothetical protein